MLLLRNEMRLISLWLIMSLQSKKWREESQVLMYVMTLGTFDFSDRILANEIQLGWWLVLMRGSPSQSEELGILQISDQGGSWINMMSNWFCVSRRVLMIKEFLQMFCKRILSFFTIIVGIHCSYQNKLPWICFHRSRYIFFDTTPC